MRGEVKRMLVLAMRVSRRRVGASFLHSYVSKDSDFLHLMQGMYASRDEFSSYLV